MYTLESPPPEICFERVYIHTNDVSTNWAHPDKKPSTMDSTTSSNRWAVGQQTQTWRRPMKDQFHWIVFWSVSPQNHPSVLTPLFGFTSAQNCTGWSHREAWNRDRKGELQKETDANDRQRATEAETLLMDCRGLTGTLLSAVSRETGSLID